MVYKTLKMQWRKTSSFTDSILKILSVDMRTYWSFYNTKLVLSMSIIPTVFKNCFRCSTCDTFLKMSQKISKRLLRCKDRVKILEPKQIMWDANWITAGWVQHWTYQRTIFFKKNFIFDFETVCVRIEELNLTKTI